MGRMSGLVSAATHSLILRNELNKQTITSEFTQIHKYLST